MIATATGLETRDVRALRRSEKVALEAWHRTHAGDDNGRPWLPGAIRSLSWQQRLALAGDEQLDAAWIERELRRVRDVRYWLPAYGHVLAGDEAAGGAPIPFTFWPRDRRAARRAIGARDQAEVLELMIEEDRLVIAKARQLGLTWLALHFGLHGMAHDPLTPNFAVLGLSQDGGYAKRLLERTRRINDLQPPYLRVAEDRETQGSKTEFKLVDRGRMISLPGTPAAPRSHQADLAIADEWAFVRNKQAGPTMTALLPAARKIFAISSGNGGPDDPGAGQSFAQLITRAAAGENEWTPVFLPASIHPARSDEWRDREIENYDDDESFLAEQPETLDDALIGAGRDRYFTLGDITAAVAAGAALDELLDTDDMPEPADEAIHGCLDLGESAQGYAIWPLEAGGIYVPPSELVAKKSEPTDTCDQLHAILLELQAVDDTGRLWPPIRELRYDAAGIQSMRTIIARARARFTAQYEHGEVRSRKVPFGKFKTGTAKYLRRLFRRTGQGRSTQIIAISPRNPELIRQLRGLESAPDGCWQKAEDQHGPDALVAGAQRIARLHRDGAVDDDDHEGE